MGNHIYYVYDYAMQKQANAIRAADEARKARIACGLPPERLREQKLAIRQGRSLTGRRTRNAGSEPRATAAESRS